MGNDPTTLDDLPPALLRHAEQVCRQFEAAWRAGQRPRVEDFLPWESGPAVLGCLRARLRALIPWFGGRGAKHEQGRS